MESLFKTLASMVGIMFWIAVVFVFDGEPDLWDVWHEKAMTNSCTVKESK